jgi:hypothetical protein
MNWTGILRVKGRGVDQEQRGKEQKGNCRMLEKAGKTQKV